MAYVIHFFLLGTFGSSILAAWDAEHCKEPAILPACLVNLKELERMTLPTNNQTLDHDCMIMRDASKCYHEYVDNCFNGTVKSELRDKMAGVRETINSLCDSSTYREKLEATYDCFQQISLDWNTCGAVFYKNAASGHSEMCKARNAFIECSMEKAKRCSKVGVKQVCRISNFYANIIVPSKVCFTWQLCPSMSARLLVQPSLLLLLAAVHLLKYF